jgi:CheY-like chemotaxis protein/class 3 adenylate cyclase
MMPPEPPHPRSDADTLAGDNAQRETPHAPAHLFGADATLRHAVRTPLNHIIGYVELLLEDARDRGLDEFVTDLQKIRKAGKELLELINNLFDPQAICPESPQPALDPPSKRAGDVAQEAGPGVQREADGTTPQHRVLVVDDNADNRAIVARLLAREGYRVSTAENGAQALERVKDEPVDLILLDVMMPVMDGIEACRRLKDAPETGLIPVVIMTALGQMEDRVRGIQAGADDFLTKPLNRDELLARIQTSLRLKHAVDTKLDHLKGTQEYLARFVPQSVIRQLEEHPEAPEIEKTDQDLSAMFVDVSGYTRLSENMRQAADFMIEKYFSRYLDSIHTHGGDVTETSGDGLMAVFPGHDPVEHAVQAAAAALEILHKTDELNVQLEGIFDPILVHIGINSGIALIGPSKFEGVSGTRWTYTALGPAVNVAARIAAIAEGGMICVGAETARRVEGRFTIRDIGRRPLKNIRGDVMIYQITAPLTQ